MNFDAFMLAYHDQFREPISLEQRAGLKRLLASLDADPNMHDLRWASYVLATAKHECANLWKPIRERGSTEYFVRRYWLNHDIRLALGNLYPDDAIRYKGRGYVQLTGRSNFRTFSGLLGIDLIAQPDLALEHQHAYSIASIGMRGGTFTGKSLAHYINERETNFYQCRRIVNGTDKAGLIEGYAVKLLVCLEEAE